MAMVTRREPRKGDPMYNESKALDQRAERAADKLNLAACREEEDGYTLVNEFEEYVLVDASAQEALVFCKTAEIIDHTEKLLCGAAEVHDWERGQIDDLLYALVFAIARVSAGGEQPEDRIREIKKTIKRLARALQAKHSGEAILGQGGARSARGSREIGLNGARR